MNTGGMIALEAGEYREAKAVKPRDDEDHYMVDGDDLDGSHILSHPPLKPMLGKLTTMPEASP